MEVEVKDFFAEDLSHCPKEFQHEFKKSFNTLKLPTIRLK